MANVNIYDMADTWNNAGTTFTAIKMNVTDTASNAASLLMDLQVGGSSKFRVDKNGGLVTSQNAMQIGTQLYLTSNNFLFASPGAFVLYNNSATLAFGASQDVVLARDAANTLALRNSTNAQAFNVYNTYTDASNYERGYAKWNSNVFEIGAEAAGTGSGQNIRIGKYNNTTKGYFEVQLADYETKLAAYYGAGSAAFFNIASGFVVSAVKETNLNAAASFGSNGIHWGASVAATVALAFRAKTSDAAASDLTLTGQAALASATTNIEGGDITITAGDGASSSAGNAHGGNLTLAGGTGYGTGHDGYIIMSGLPTSASGLPAGALWSNSGVLTVA